MTIHLQCRILVSFAFSIVSDNYFRFFNKEKYKTTLVNLDVNLFNLNSSLTYSI